MNKLLNNVVPRAVAVVMLMLAAGCSKDGTSTLVGTGVTYCSVGEKCNICSTKHTADIGIVTSGGWHAELSDTSFGRLQQGSESGNGGTSRVYVDFDENKTGQLRNTELRVYVDGYSQPFKVAMLQKIATGLANVSCDQEVTLSGAEEQYTLTFDATAAWTAHLSDNSFCSLSQTSGKAGDCSLILSFDANNSADRSTTLYVTVDGYNIDYDVCVFTQQKNSGISAVTVQSEFEISASAQSIVVGFAAADQWIASVSDSSICSLSPAAGMAGSNSIILAFTGNSSAEPRKVVLNIRVDNFASSGKDVCTITQAGVGSDMEAVNTQFTDAVLREYYLWNDEYKTLTPNYTQNYDTFLSNTLSSMTTNSLDGHWTNGTRDHIYSFITRSANGSASAAGTRAQVAVSGFGIKTDPFRFDNDEVFFAVTYVYPDSPAQKAGITRGTLIGKINGVQLTVANYYGYYTKYFSSYPSVGTQIVCSLYDNDKKAYTSEVTLKAAAMLENPVVYSKIETVGSRKIGYLVYTSFDASYDDKLREVLSNFKSNNITDLILDLRYNGGGHVSSSLMLSSAIAGSQCIDKVFAYYRYNDTRMVALGKDPQNPQTYPSSKFDVTTASVYGLSPDKVVVITTSNTASASELVINSLRGIDINVITVGTTTNGKNVGMEGKTTEKSMAGYDYTLYAITFQSYNAKYESDYASGFVPSFEYDDSNNLPQPWGQDRDLLYTYAKMQITGVATYGRSTRASNAHHLSSPRNPELHGAIITPAEQHRLIDEE